MLNSPILTVCYTAGTKGNPTYLCVKQEVVPIVSVKDIHLFTISCVSIISTGETALYQRPQLLWGLLPVTFFVFLKVIMYSVFKDK
jgi:hypothetical protein